MQYWKHYKYKNLTFIFLSIGITFLLFQNEIFHLFLLQLGSLGYIGAFIAGMLFVSTFTVATGALVLLVLAQAHSAIELGLIAGLGAVLGDITIFHFIRSQGLTIEIHRIMKSLGGDKISHLLHTKYFIWTLPVIGAIIIASPLPDELGIGLMGISRLKTYQFLIVSFILNAVGITLVVMASSVVKP